MSVMISNRLSRIMGDRLIKITQMAKDTGLSRTTITNLYYRRTRQIDIETLNKVCNYLQCQISDILEFTPDEKSQEEKQRKAR